jgi:predicted metalloprotease with PDZ domain
VALCNGTSFLSPLRAGFQSYAPHGRLAIHRNIYSKIRAASKGKRNLDDVIVPLFKKRAAGERFDVPTLVAAFEHEYGPDARTDFHSVNVLGETVNPPSEAFGVGFQRRSKIFNVQGKDVQGYEWIRIPSVSEEQIRQR